MQRRTITAVRKESIGSEFAWIIEMDVEGALPWVYANPVHTLGLRSAEYGIDPNDVDTLIDIMIHEHHFQVPDSHPTFLWNTDEKTAREAHLARVADAKTRVTHLDPNNLLGIIRESHNPNDPMIGQFRATILAARRRMI